MSRHRKIIAPIADRRSMRRPTTARPAIVATGVKSILLIASDLRLGPDRDMEEVLRSAGYNVTVADGIAQAISLCETQSFDLLISGAALSDETAWTLTNDLKTRCGGRGMIVSAAGMSPTARRALEGGYGVYVADSLDRDSLLRSVQDLLRTE